MKTYLATVDRSTEMTDPANNRLEIRDGLIHAQIDGVDKVYDEKLEKWETTEERSARNTSEALKDPNSLASIKDELDRSESFDDGQEFVR
jgi:hypothetical protein